MRQIGRCLDNLNKKQEALEWYRKATREAPSIKDCWMALGHAYYGLEMYVEAYAVFLVVPSINKNRKEDT